MPTPAHTFQTQILTARRGERIVFYGTPDVAVPTLEALAETNLRPIAVITEPDKPVGRQHRLTPLPIKRAAQRLGIAVSQPTTTAELMSITQSLLPTLGIVVAYGRILKAELLAIPTLGFVNLHFSLLPAYRGATPIQAALLNGDVQTGVTLMQLDPGLDTGPILGFTPMIIEPTDTTGSLGTRLAATAATLASELIPIYLAGSLQPQPQPTSSKPVTRRLNKDDGRIDWQWPVERIERFIRAMDPWPRSWTEIEGLRIIIHSAHLADGQLVIDRIQVAGGRIITSSEFARGYPAGLTALVATGKVTL